MINIYQAVILGILLLLPESMVSRAVNARMTNIESSRNYRNNEINRHTKSNEKFNSETNMNKYISTLMSKMTIDEKIGQLNLWGVGDIAGGNVGAILGLRGVKPIRDIQEIAVKKSRLGMPLLFAENIVHGYQTTFPIPLGLSCS